MSRIKVELLTEKEKKNSSSSIPRHAGVENTLSAKQKPCCFGKLTHQSKYSTHEDLPAYTSAKRQDK